MASRRSGARVVRPKIVASTATVRRATDQIEALFDRRTTGIFPPPGVDRTDSFFARTVPATNDPARMYMGIAAQGRGPKLVFLRSLTTLLAAAQSEFNANVPAGGGSANPADPYMTAVCYFNALRELGGARRIVEDEVRDRTARYGTERHRVDPPGKPFADRRIKEPLELTSRVSTDEVAKARQRLESRFENGADRVDVALATNMISVGLDITRLGLMIVQGQPKTAAEYIQATSRVGRDPSRPGLVVAVLNLHKPRDRMHFEQFGQFHRTFYRS
ncbi:MAG: helicase-related protein, partial [Xanthobacteraceae bacterium]